MIADGGEWELRLVDIDPESLDVAQRLSQRLVEAQDAPIDIRASQDRRALLPGADAVVTTVGVGGRRAWEQDVFVPRQFGIYQSIGDTCGAGGISRALRMVPPMMEIANDVVALCPDAIFANYSNPMSVICRAIHENTDAAVTGLCIGTKWVHDYLARLIGAHPNEVWSAAVGVNHLTWFTELRHQQEDAWPLVRQKMAENKTDVEMLEGTLLAGLSATHSPFSWELFQVFGAFPTLFDAHIIEFFPGWKRKGGCYGRTLGVDAMPFEHIIQAGDEMYQRMADEAYGRVPLGGEFKTYGRVPSDDEPEDIEVGEHTQLVQILRTIWGGDGHFFSVNLPNTGQVSNLPMGAVLEATTLVNGSGFHPLSFGELPSGISAILQRIIGVQELTTQAAVRGDRRLVVQAMLADGDVLTRAQAEALTDALLDAQREWLPQFYS
jgi:alpha-galactosidase